MAGRLHDHHRLLDKTQPWRRWYKTSRWQKLRWSVLVRDAFTCRMCHRIEADTSRLVADHKTPHHGNETLFWDDTNLQTVCKDCHDGVKQRADKTGAIIGSDADGRPTDPAHPWNR